MAAELELENVILNLEQLMIELTKDYEDTGQMTYSCKY